MESTVNITARAANRICEITAGQNETHSLRISVNGGGCSGFQYDFAIATDRNDDDIAIEKDGATVLIDSVSLGYMSGSTVDFVDDQQCIDRGNGTIATYVERLRCIEEHDPIGGLVRQRDVAGQLDWL